MVQLQQEPRTIEHGVTLGNGYEPRRYPQGGMPKASIARSNTELESNAFSTKAASSSSHQGTVGAPPPAVASYDDGYEPTDTPWLPAIASQPSPPPVPEGTEEEEAMEMLGE